MVVIIMHGSGDDDGDTDGDVCGDNSYIYLCCDGWSDDNSG
jgi:hypothetical protein